MSHHSRSPKIVKPGASKSKRHRRGATPLARRAREQPPWLLALLAILIALLIAAVLEPGAIPAIVQVAAYILPNAK